MSAPDFHNGQSVRQPAREVEDRVDSRAFYEKWLIHNARELDDRVFQIENQPLFRAYSGIRSQLSRLRGRLKRLRGTPSRDSRRYPQWSQQRSASLAAELEARSEGWTFRPVIHVVLPITGDVRRVTKSISGQRYDWWRMLLAGGDSETADARIMSFSGEHAFARAVRAVPVAEDSFIAVARPDIRLLPHALAAVVDALRQHRDATLYSDGEFESADGMPVRPEFKPGWSPTLFETVDYLSPFVVMPSRVPATLPDAELTAERLVRAAVTRSKEVYHVPHVLYRREEGRAEMREPARRSESPAAARHTVSIVICTRNGQLLDRCLQKLRSGTDAAQPLEVIVVRHDDCGSRVDRGIREVILRHRAKPLLYRGPFNYALMNNLAVRHASGEYVVLMNDDVFPLGTDWLRRMLQRLEEPDIGVVGALLHYPDGTIQHAGVTVGDFTLRHTGRGTRESELWPWLTMTRDVRAVTGACMATRRETYEQLHGIDESFPVNYNDIDFCMRVRKAGYRVVLEAGARLVHEESKSRTGYVSYDEKLRFWRRWADAADEPDPWYSPSLRHDRDAVMLR